MIWLPYGLAEDSGDAGTDGHSDNVIQFIRPGLALFQAASHDRSNPNWELAAGEPRGAGRPDRRAGRPIEVVEIELLSYTRELEGERRAAPYTNFYPVNGGIIAPRLDVPEDEVAYRLLADLFPGREVVSVPTDFQAYGGGGIGCITQQLPAGRRGLRPATCLTRPARRRLRDAARVGAAPADADVVALPPRDVRRGDGRGCGPAICPGADPAGGGRERRRRVRAGADARATRAAGRGAADALVTDRAAGGRAGRCVDARQRADLRARCGRDAWRWCSSASTAGASPTSPMRWTRGCRS